jgi:hypothetical protein
MRREIIFQKTLATSAWWVSFASPNENWAPGGCGDKSDRMRSPHPPALFSFTQISYRENFNATAKEPLRRRFAKRALCLISCEF